MRIPAQRLAVDRDPQATALKVQRYSVEGVPMNARWLSRRCPKCRGVLAVIVRPPHENPPFQAVNGRCKRRPATPARHYRMALKSLASIEREIELVGDRDFKGDAQMFEVLQYGAYQA